MCILWDLLHTSHHHDISLCSTGCFYCVWFSPPTLCPLHLQLIKFQLQVQHWVLKDTWMSFKGNKTNQLMDSWVIFSNRGSWIAGYIVTFPTFLHPSAAVMCSVSDLSLFSVSTPASTQWCCSWWNWTSWIRKSRMRSAPPPLWTALRPCSGANLWYTLMACWIWLQVPTAIKSFVFMAAVNE